MRPRGLGQGAVRTAAGGDDAAGGVLAAFDPKLWDASAYPRSQL